MLMMGSPSRTIVWFRRDLRIEDNPALLAASRDGACLPVFIWCPSEEGQFYPGRCSRWWLKQSLFHLDQSLKSIGAHFVFMKAESTVSALLQCVNAVGATRVVYNRLYDPVSIVRDLAVKSELLNHGIAVQTFNGDLLYEPWEVFDESRHAFTTFKEFWKRCLSLSTEPAAFLSPFYLVPPSGIESVGSCSIEELGLENESEKQSNALLSRLWLPGWRNAEEVLSKFTGENLLEYSKKRVKLDGTFSSLLSPYLHFGEISVRKIYQIVRMKQKQWTNGKLDATESVDFFLHSIGLREYARHLCFNFPFTFEKSLMENLKHFPWRVDAEQFKSWRQGRTGYPLVDAGMRELWATGWMHNSSRVIVASFCVKFLLLPWTWGMKYFWDTLLDADLENDILGWQYISGSLPDGHELNRLDRPEEQGRKFDPDGEYIRIWIPELARMPTQWIHHPWDAPASILKAAGVDLGSNYPKPIVNINTARERLNDAVSMMWQLDRASKAQAFITSSEIVADNIKMQNFDIPKVFVKKETYDVSSSLDQRVPSFHDMMIIGNIQGRTNADCVVKEKTEFDFSKEKVSACEDEDLRSTAKSSSTKKRSICEAQFSVPTLCCVSDDKTIWECDTFKAQFLIGSSSSHPAQNDGSMEAQILNGAYEVTNVRGIEGL